MNNQLEDIRFDWTVEEIKEIYCRPLLDLVLSAGDIHRKYHDCSHIQKASLLSIKTGGCPENCSYCSQSAHHREVELTKDKLMNPAHVISLAKRAKEAGASRFCMGAAWRQVKDGKEFDAVVEMVRGVRALNMEACVTLGMLKPHQAARLKEAGLTAYNHNLDTSPEYYSDIVTTRTYEDRLETLRIVREADIDICCGGIIGLGETIDDRCSMLKILSSMRPHPESVPINALVAIKGTPLQDKPPIDPLEFIRMIATTRLVMPKSVVRLSAGRSLLSREAQILCFLAGANSLFYGDVLLTTPNIDTYGDKELFKQMGAII